LKIRMICWVIYLELKTRALHEGVQNPTAKKSKLAESSSDEFFLPRWQDFGWERAIIFLTRNKLKFPPLLFENSVLNSSGC
jgi:hypothetical protein